MYYFRKYSGTGNYICLFAVIFDEFDIAGNMIVYPRSVDGTPLEIYGGFQDAELIEKIVLKIYIKY